MSPADLSSNALLGKLLARIATLTMVSIAYFIFALVALHFLRPDYNPISRFVSEYAVGPYGLLMTSAFASLSLGSLALVIGLYQGVARSGRSRLGLVLLAIWGVGVLIAGIFPADLQSAPETTTGRLHERASGLAFLSLILATLLLSWRFKQDAHWSSFHRPAVILSLMILVALIGLFLLNSTRFAGLSQRIFIIALLVWLLRTAAHLRRVANQSILN
jgi:hypothetical protein